VTVAVWIGYDNADGKRRTLGGGVTGGGFAVPIFEPVIQAAWAQVAPRTALAPPSPEARRQLACKFINLDSGDMQSTGGRTITECFRIDRNGQVLDTQYRLVSREDAYTNPEPRGYYGVAPNPNPFGWGLFGFGRNAPAPRDPRPPAPYFGQYGGYWRDPRLQDPRVQPPRDPYGREYQTPQRIDPGYIWGGRRYY
jgi:penicillin-binding protein 1A